MTSSSSCSRAESRASTALLLLLLAACNDGDDTPRYVRSCAANCERAQQCLSSVDLQECNADCERQFEDIGPHLRADYLAGIEACVADLSCAELALSSITNTCPNESRAKLGPSQTAIQLCEVVSESLQKCVGLSLGTALCLERAKVFDDRSLRLGVLCGEQPCDQAAQCLTDALGTSLLSGN